METISLQLKNSRRLRRSIMRRVWYVYGLSLLLRPALVVGLVLGGSAIAFWRLVSITSIVHNTLSVQVGYLPRYIFDALIQADVLALVAFSGLVFGLVMIIVKLLSGLRVQFVYQIQ